MGKSDILRKLDRTPDGRQIRYGKHTYWLGGVVTDPAEVEKIRDRVERDAARGRRRGRG